MAKKKLESPVARKEKEFLPSIEGPDEEIMRFLKTARDGNIEIAMELYKLNMEFDKLFDSLRLLVKIVEECSPVKGPVARNELH